MFTLSTLNKLSSAKFLVCFRFQSAFNAAQNWWKCCLSVKQLGFGWDAELLGVSSRSKLFANGTIVVLGRLRVKNTILSVVKASYMLLKCWILIWISLLFVCWYLWKWRGLFTGYYVSVWDCLGINTSYNLGLIAVQNPLMHNLQLVALFQTG